MTDLAKATPRPWCISATNGYSHIDRAGPEESGMGLIATVWSAGSPDGKTSVNNAALIVCAVNLHDELLSILRGCVDAFEAIGNMPVAYDRARAVLAKVDAP